jgi:hypothetical protein
MVLRRHAHSQSLTLSVQKLKKFARIGAANDFRHLRCAEDTCEIMRVSGLRAKPGYGCRPRRITALEPENGPFHAYGNGRQAILISEAASRPSIWAMSANFEAAHVR